MSAPKNPKPKTKGQGERAHRSTQAIVQQRVTEILKIRLGGAQWQDIRDFANSPEDVGRVGKPWNLSDSQLKKYIQASNKMLAETLDKQRPELFNLHIAQRRSLYARAIDQGDLRTALAVLKDEAQLCGLYDYEFLEKMTKDYEALRQRLDAGDAARTLNRTVTKLTGQGSPDFAA